jgi:hypothetical protein
MASKGFMRTDYWNRVTGSVRTGDTRRDESVTDVEDFLLPYGHAGLAGLHLWGIADGLSVTATANQAGLTITPGTAIDAAGHLIVLAAGGMAVVDPDIDPADVANIATVAVDSPGVSLPTTGHTGSQYLIIRYLEVSVEGLLGNSPTLLHAPWLRLLPTDGFEDSGTGVVLARVTLTQSGVTVLSSDLRRLAGLPAERLQLRRPTTSTGTSALSVAHAKAAELRARSDGVVVLEVPGAPTPALTVAPNGRIGIGIDAQQAQRPLHVEGGEIHCGGADGGFSFADRTTKEFVDEPSDTGQRWRWYANNGIARLWSGTDQLTIAPNGRIGIGIDAQQAQRPLHVEGREIHCGGGRRRILLRRPDQTIIRRNTHGRRTLDLVRERRNRPAQVWRRPPLGGRQRQHRRRNNRADPSATCRQGAGHSPERAVRQWLHRRCDTALEQLELQRASQ